MIVVVSRDFNIRAEIVVIVVQIFAVFQNVIGGVLVRIEVDVFFVFVLLGGLRLIFGSFRHALGPKQIAGLFSAAFRADRRNAVQIVKACATRDADAFQAEFWLCHEFRLSILNRGKNKNGMRRKGRAHASLRAPCQTSSAKSGSGSPRSPAFKCLIDNRRCVVIDTDWRRAE